MARIYNKTQSTPWYSPCKSTDMHVNFARLWRYGLKNKLMKWAHTSSGKHQACWLQCHENYKTPFFFPHENIRGRLIINTTLNSWIHSMIWLHIPWAVKNKRFPAYFLTRSYNVCPPVPYCSTALWSAVLKSFSLWKLPLRDLWTSSVWLYPLPGPRWGRVWLNKTYWTTLSLQSPLDRGVWPYPLPGSRWGRVWQKKTYWTTEPFSQHSIETQRSRG